MPTYKNNGTQRRVVGGDALEPGKTGTTVVFESSPDLELISVNPCANPCLLSQKVTAAGVFAIPEGVQQANIYINVISGEPEVRFNSDTNDPSIKLFAGARWSVRMKDRIYQDIRFFGSGFVAFFTVEK